VIAAAVGGRNGDARVLDRGTDYRLTYEALQNFSSLEKLCGPLSIGFGFDELEELIESVVHGLP
jgi:hypothetical protein